MPKLLLVEDDDFLKDTLKRHLKREGYTVDVVSFGKEALERLDMETYDVLVIDWGLPDIQGVEVVKQYRSKGGMIPTLMLTGRNHHTDKIAGLDSGADDYLTKPFETLELIARIRALLRRPAVRVSANFEFGNLSLDTASGTVEINGKKCDLLPKEFALLSFFMRHKNQVLSAQTILDNVWSSEQSVTTDNIRPYITRIRQKLQDGKASAQITTRKGFGYLLELSGADSKTES